MTAPLRVLTYLDSLPIGGVELVTMRLVRAWRASGVDVRIALGRREGALVDQADDLPFIELGIGARFASVAMIAKLRRVIGCFRPHVVLAASNNHTVTAFALRQLMGRDCPPIVLAISNDLVRGDMHPVAVAWDEWHLRMRGSTYAAVVAMVPEMRADIARLMRIPASRVTAIRTASLTHDQLMQFARARNSAVRTGLGRRFVGIGRLTPQKNFELLVDAFARIAREGDRLAIIGEGPSRAAIEQRAAALGVSRKVDLPGAQRDIAGILATHDAFVLSSDYEGVPAVVIEAMASGIPIVATRCTVAMPSLIEGVGCLVPIRDAVALSAAMNAIGDQEPRAREMRRRAAMFTVEANAPAWIALFETLAQRKRLDAGENVVSRDIDINGTA